jgi:hypothetical protein
MPIDPTQLGEAVGIGLAVAGGTFVILWRIGKMMNNGTDKNGATCKAPDVAASAAELLRERHEGMMKALEYLGKEQRHTNFLLTQLVSAQRRMKCIVDTPFEDLGRTD